MKFKIFRFKKVQSTNNTALRLIKTSNFNYGMVISDMQSKGRGQYGREWISYKGNLFVSFYFTLENIRLTIRQLTKENCYLVKRLISKYYKKNILFKKPNDLLINKKKVCGILQESIKKKDNNFLIIGIGINIIRNPKNLDYPTTNLFELTGKKFNYNLVANSLRLTFEKEYSKYF